MVKTWALSLRLRILLARSRHLAIHRVQDLPNILLANMAATRLAIDSPITYSACRILYKVIAFDSEHQLLELFYKFCLWLQIDLSYESSNVVGALLVSTSYFYIYLERRMASQVTSSFLSMYMCRVTKYLTLVVCWNKPVHFTG